MSTRGSRYGTVLDGEDVNPFEVLGLDPSSPLTIEDILHHFTDVVLPHLTDPDIAAYRHATTFPTLRQALWARDLLIADGALVPMLERWASSTFQIWNPHARPGSPAALLLSINRSAPLEESHRRFAPVEQSRRRFHRPTRTCPPSPSPPAAAKGSCGP
jgi:hypothetical protein